MVGLADALRSAFSFLSSRNRNEERMAQYVLREHHRGRTLAEIHDAPYVRNRCTPAQVERLLDRPELMHAIGADMVASVRSQQ